MPNISAGDTVVATRNGREYREGARRVTTIRNGYDYREGQEGRVMSVQSDGSLNIAFDDGIDTYGCSSSNFALAQHYVNTSNIMSRFVWGVRR